MPKKTYVKIDDSWRNVKAVWIKVAGVWKKVIPKGKIGGVWKEFIQYLFNIYTLGTEHVQIVPGYTEAWTGNQTTKNADHLYLEARASWANVSWGVVSFVTDKPIDVTSFSKMYVTWSVTSGGNSGAYFGLVTSKTTKALTASGFSASADNKTQEINIVALQGNYHLAIFANGNEPTSQNGNVRITVYKIWLE